MHSQSIASPSDICDTVSFGAGLTTVLQMFIQSFFWLYLIQFQQMRRQESLQIIFSPNFAILSLFLLNLLSFQTFWLMLWEKLLSGTSAQLKKTAKF